MDAEALRALLRYDASTGVIYWLYRAGVCRTWNTRYAGTAAGSLDTKGYLAIKVNGRLYRAHRLAWILHYGEWPSDEVDHINGIRDDNRIANLRIATHQQQAWNMKGHGKFLKGVRKNGRGFMAQIAIRRKTLCLGTYSTEIEAHEAYRRKAAELFGDFACTWRGDRTLGDLADQLNVEGGHTEAASAPHPAGRATTK